METLLYVALGGVVLWRVVRVIGRWRCRKIGHQWIGMHATVEGHVKVACGRCGEVGWMTTDQWRAYFSALDPDEQKLCAKFGISNGAARQ